ncbi:MAG: DUF1800 domain-containing protein [Comamonadaceae bacterium]|nr:DUF1800 domain-containing protein [Comamonadaceae bacterium]
MFAGKPGDASLPPHVRRRPSLKIALDTLFNHPNVGPFIGRQLIQRLVTSNPSPAYVRPRRGRLRQQRRAACAATLAPWCAPCCWMLKKVVGVFVLTSNT